MASSDRGVPRGDNVPAGEQEQSIEKQEANYEGDGVQAKAAAAAQPPRDSETKPGYAKDSDRGGSVGWGAEPSGGSVHDKRSPDK